MAAWDAANSALEKKTKKNCVISPQNSFWTTSTRLVRCCIANSAKKKTKQQLNFKRVGACKGHLRSKAHVANEEFQWVETEKNRIWEKRNRFQRLTGVAGLVPSSDTVYSQQVVWQDMSLRTYPSAGYIYGVSADEKPQVSPSLTLGRGLETADYNIGLRNNNTTSTVPKVSTKVEQQQPRRSDKHWDREAEMSCEWDWVCVCVRRH